LTVPCDAEVVHDRSKVERVDGHTLVCTLSHSFWSQQGWMQRTRAVKW